MKPRRRGRKTTRWRAASQALSWASRCFAWPACCWSRRTSTPSVWREIGAAAISPSLGFNRLTFGKRFDAIFPSRHPAYFAQLQLGAALTAHKTDQGRDQPVDTGEGIADFSMEYGQPGKTDYVYARPFDYFAFQFTASTANVFENILTRGLLLGTDYAIGKNYRGVWGLYGSYDYISPQTFRVSSTALSLGTTAQWWLARSIALQTTALAGVGYGAGGTIHGQGERDYRYGATPQALLALRFLFGERASVSIVRAGLFHQPGCVHRGPRTRKHHARRDSR